MDNINGIESRTGLDPAQPQDLALAGKGTAARRFLTAYWLTKDEAKLLVNAPDIGTTDGKRDRALLEVMLECGLRLAEVEKLQWEHIQKRDAGWVILDLKSKGGRRSIPLPDDCKAAVDAWTGAAGITAGSLFRLTYSQLHLTVKFYARKCGFPHIAPPDLRRTCLLRLSRMTPGCQGRR